MTLLKWTADFANDPNDDFNITIEILCDDKDVAIIKQTPNGLMMTWYETTKRLNIPVDWLSGLLETAKRRFAANA